MKSFFDTVFHRSSVRSFTSDPVTEEEVESLLKAAMAAPSAVNRQPWEFITITDKGILEKLADRLPYAKMAKMAPLGIVVCADPDLAHEGKIEYAVIDAACACENLLLAADALGLGAVWTAVYPQPGREAIVRDVLQIPQKIIPLAFIPIGRPRGEERPKDKYKAEKVHREKW
jgi:nitroreductase